MNHIICENFNHKENLTKKIAKKVITIKKFVDITTNLKE